MSTPAAVVSGDCPHEEWTAQAQIIRETDVEGGPVVAWSVNLTMACVACGAPMLWSGVRASNDDVFADWTPRPQGRQVIQPMVSPDRLVVAIPCEPHPPGARDG